MLGSRAETDFTIIALLDQPNRTILDYFLLPSTALANGQLYLTPANAHRFESMRFKSVEAMFGRATASPGAEASARAASGH